MSLATIERFYAGAYTTRTCVSEQDYYDLWHACGLHTMSPGDSAIAGALLADRLPWVFAAGYQATLHNAFPGLPRAGWAAFAATEEACDLLAQARGPTPLCASLLTPLYPHTCSLYAHLSAHACPLRPRQAREAQGESAYGADRGLGTSGHAYAHPAAAASCTWRFRRASR